MKIERWFMFFGGVLLIASGIINMVTMFAGASSMSLISNILFVVASIFMIIDLVLRKRKKK